MFYFKQIQNETLVVENLIDDYIVCYIFLRIATEFPSNRTSIPKETYSIENIARHRRAICNVFAIVSRFILQNYHANILRLLEILSLSLYCLWLAMKNVEYPTLQNASQDKYLT